jgi:hypothetical protein
MKAEWQGSRGSGRLCKILPLSIFVNLAPFQKYHMYSLKRPYFIISSCGSGWAISVSLVRSVEPGEAKSKRRRSEGEAEAKRRRSDKAKRRHAKAREGTRREEEEAKRSERKRQEEHEG